MWQNLLQNRLCMQSRINPYLGLTFFKVSSFNKGEAEGTDNKALLCTSEVEQEMCETNLSLFFRNKKSPHKKNEPAENEKLT